MATVIIDQRELEIPEGQRLNGIEAAALLGIEIPHYCWHPALSVVGSCRMCVVEVGTRDAETGEITMQPKVVPACNTYVSDGMVIVTNSEKVAAARAMVEEDLLLRHPIDCPICDKAGECRLQDYHFLHGQEERRADVRPFSSRRRDVSENVTLFVDRCILCTRCVRFTRQVSQTSELMVSQRGTHEEIDIFPDMPMKNSLSGNVVDLCPVGALGDKNFLYQQRVWFMKPHAGICTGCATGCSIWIEENQDRIYRIRPRDNLEVNQWWICNDGRYGFDHVHDERRLLQPSYAGREGDSREAGPIDWTGLPKQLADAMKSIGRLAAVISPHLTVEEAYLLCKAIRSFDKKALLVVGPIPEGQKETFPTGFTISSEKCPNRRGVEEIVASFSDRRMTWHELLGEIDKGKLDGVWVSGGYREKWIDETTALRFAKVGLLIVQDLFPTPLSDRATYQLPGAAFAERNGHYVNGNDRLQWAPWAIRPPSGVRTEASVFWEMLGKDGLFDAKRVLDEITRDIVYFSAAVDGVPEEGIDLRVNQLA